MTECRETSSKRSGQPLAVMAKPVGARCNLACSYCYYHDPISDSHAADSPRMTPQVLEALVRQTIAASPGPVVSFTWHGGEPTLAGRDFFQAAIELQQRWLPPGWTCWNNLQTNGVLLDDAWCDFLAQNSFDVGISIDGTAQLHDSVRIDRGGHGSYARVVSAIRRLQAHGIQPDLLCTVTSAIAREPGNVYQALRDLETGWIQFIPIVRRAADGGTTDDFVSAEEYGRFLCEIFDRWLYRDLGRLEVQLFAELSLMLAGGSTNLCHLAPTCGRVLVVERDGGVYACDHFCDAGHRLGSILEHSLAELVDRPAQRRFGQAKQVLLPQQCRTCEWLPLCQGGCPKDRLITTADGEPGLNILCAGLRRFYAHAAPQLRTLVERRRQGLPPERIMEVMRAEARVRWLMVGRNDPCPCGSGRKAKLCCAPRYQKLLF